MTRNLQLAYEIEDLVERFNALPDSIRWERQHGRPKYDRWKVVRILRAAQVEITQERKGDGARGTNMYVTHAALARALDGDLLNSLLDVEMLSEPEAAVG